MYEKLSGTTLVPMANHPNHLLNSSPILSIIIPTFNRPDQLRSCLRSIAAMNDPKYYIQVIVVDDGSIPSIIETINGFSPILDVTCYRQKNNGPASARNLGAYHAKAPFLAFIDDDCTLPVDWLENVTKRLDNTTTIGGSTINGLKNNIFAATSQMLIDFLYDHYNRNKIRFIASNNIIIPKEIFSRINGFSNVFRKAAAEDRDLCNRLTANNYPMAFIPQIRVFHHHTMTIKSFLMQHFNYGYGASLYHRRRRPKKSRKSRLEAPGFYFQLIFYPFLNRQSSPRFLIFTLLIASQTATLIGFLRQRMDQWNARKRWLFL